MSVRRVASIPVMLAALVVVASACTRTTPAAPVREVEPPPSPDFVPPPGFDHLTLSATPYLDPASLDRSLQPLAAYLSRALKVPVQVDLATSYADLGERMRQGTVDLGSFSPLSYVRARKADPKLMPIVNFISDGSATSAGYIVVKAEGPLKSLADLRGKRFAFVDPSSTTGYLYPSALLRSKGIEPASYFSETHFLGNHEAALMAVYEDRADAAAIYQGALRALQRNQQIDPLSFRIIAKTLRTPKDILCARDDLPAEVVTQIRRALLALSVRTALGREILTPLDVNGFIPADDRLYETVRQVDQQMASTQ